MLTRIAFYLIYPKQMTAEEFAKAVFAPSPDSLNGLLDVIFRGCDLKEIVEKAGYATTTPEIGIVTQHLQVRAQVVSVEGGQIIHASRWMPIKACCM